MTVATSTALRTSRSVEHLLADHREGERIINQLEQLLNDPPAGGCWSAARSETFTQLSHFFNERVLGHIRKEEDLLFPALEAFLPRDIGPLAVLRGEHEELTVLFRRLLESGAALSKGAGDTEVCRIFETTGRALIQGFRDHVYKEDRILFPMVTRFLSPERDAYLLSEMVKSEPR